MVTRDGPTPATPEFATLMYQDVTDDPAASGFRRPGALPFKLTRAAFGAHLDAIAANACLPTRVDAADIEAPGRRLLLTFDDGGASALWIGEALERRGWRGHFFVVTSLIGQPGFLSRAAIRELAGRGHLIGSHSHTHPDICRDLPADRMLAEWRTSRDVVADLLGERCLAASVPGGDISARVLHAASVTGYHYIFTSEPWLTPHWVGGAWVLGRFTVTARTPARQVGELARFRGWQRALLLRRLTVAARRAAPSLYRHYVARRTRESA
jgi:peptidoglycan/xylan/chitin deacetylase (PgdA/CDA1 family)